MAKKKQAEQPADESLESSPVEDVDTSALEASLESEVVESAAPETTETTDESAEQDSSGASLREFLAAKGVQVQGDSDDEAVASIAERLTRYEQIEHEREQYRQQLNQYQLHLQSLQPQLTELTRWQAEQAKAKEPAAPAPDAWLDKLLEAPQLPKDWQSYLDPTTKALREDTPPNVRQAVADYVDYRDNLPTRVAADLKANLPALIRAEAAKQLQEQLNPQIETIRSQQAQHEFVRANADWLYEKDASGRPIYDPITLNGPPSFAGNLFGQFLQQAMDDGITNRDKAIGRAMRDLQNYVAVQKASTQTAASTGESSRQQFVNAGKRTPSRAGSIPRSSEAPAQNSGQSFKEQFAAALKGSDGDWNE